MPAPVVPVTTHVDSFIRYHNQMKGAGRNNAFATRAHVFLARLIGLDRADGYVEKSAHAISASTAPTASTTIAMSSAELFCGRNGLNPIPETVTAPTVCLPSQL